MGTRAERGPAGGRFRIVESAPLPYVVSVPVSSGHEDEGGEGGSRLPVLLFLHGYDEGTPTPLVEGVTRHGPLFTGSADVARDRFVVVAPQLPRAGDFWHRHADDVWSIVEDVVRTYGGDPERLYLTGFSFGGNGVFDLALAGRNRWAALWAVDPTRAPREDPGRPVWLSVGDVARDRAHQFARVLLLQHATGEPLPDRVTLDEGDDHVGSARRAYSDARIYRWLLGRSLRRP